MNHCCLRSMFPSQNKINMYKFNVQMKWSSPDISLLMTDELSVINY